MKGTLTTGFSERDILFLLETVDPALLSKMDTIKTDPGIIEGMMEHEAHRVFQRIMLMDIDRITPTITPRFLFEILLRIARKDLQTQTYTIERTGTQKVPVFDVPEVVRFLGNKAVLKYLADMLASFTRIESFTLPIRVRKGVWLKIRFNDMDIDSLLKFCQNVDEEHRFAFYKRIADLCLFILGIFPEYVTTDYRYSSSVEARTRLFNRLRRSAQDYEEEGRRFYKLAGEHGEATLLGMAEVLLELHHKFELAKKPLNYISENFLRFRKERLFPFLHTN